MALQPLYLQLPTEERWLNISKRFWTKWQFPNCVGALDGKHIRIKAPPNSGTLFYNYKGFFSTVLLAVCDADYRFLYVDVGDYGSHNDAEIFQSCGLGRRLANGTMNLPPHQCLPDSNYESPVSFVGDEAFPLRTYLMGPYNRRSLVSNEQRIFNFRLSRARRVIENAFGILVARWSVLSSSLCFKVDTVDNIVLALVCLHNYLMQDEENAIERRYNPPGLVDEEGPNGELIEGEWRRLHLNHGLNRLGRVGANFGGLNASLQRDVLANYFISQQGAIPWQERFI